MKSVTIKTETLTAVGSSGWFGFRSSLNPSLWSSSKCSWQRSAERVGRTWRQPEDPPPAGSVRLVRFQTHDSPRDPACRASANALHNPGCNLWTATSIIPCRACPIGWRVVTEPNEKLTDSRLAVNVGRQSDARQPGRFGSRHGWRLFGVASCSALPTTTPGSPVAIGKTGRRRHARSLTQPPAACLPMPSRLARTARDRCGTPSRLGCTTGDQWPSTNTLCYAERPSSGTAAGSALASATTAR